MSTHHEIGPVERWLARPLCIRYAAGVFRSTQVKVQPSEEVSNFSVCWGIGCLLDGKREVLGAWPMPEADAARLKHVAEDLQARGVLRIRTLTGCCVACMFGPTLQDVGPAIRCAQVVQLQGGALTESAQFRALRRPMAEAVVAGESLAEEIQQRLSAAVSRRRAFSDRADAMKFVVATLHRADRRLWVKAAPSHAERAHASPVAACAHH